MTIYDKYAISSNNPYYTAINESACELLARKENGISSLEEIPYTWIAREAGCAPSTVKKYLDPNYIGKNLKVYKDKPKIEIIHKIDDFSVESIDKYNMSNTFAAYGFENNASSLPEYSGIYLITQAHYCLELNQMIYLAKIGKASNLKNRGKSYTTTNPLAVFRDYIVCHNYDEMEISYQNALRKISKGQVSNLEWFIVDELTYRKLCNKGMRAI